MPRDDAELELQLRAGFDRATAPVHGAGVREDEVRDIAARRRRTRNARRYALAGVATAAAAIALVVLVRPDQDRVSTADDPSTTTSDPPTSTTSTTDGTTTTSSSTTSTATSPTTAVPELPEFPPQSLSLTHGGSAWGLYLAVDPEWRSDTPEMTVAFEAAEAAGYQAGSGTLGCDQGAAAALGLDEEADINALAVHFDTEDQARQAQAAFEARDFRPLGIAHVVTYCMD